jgi:hypothetical protein
MPSRLATELLAFQAVGKGDGYPASSSSVAT